MMNRRFIQSVTVNRWGALAILCVLAIGGAGYGAQEKKPAEGPWKSLFNGKDLVGWTPKIAGHPLGENYKDTFRVKDGLLTVSYDQYERFDNAFGHLFYKAPFSHYRIHLEYRFVGEQAAGGPG